MYIQRKLSINLSLDVPEVRSISERPQQNNAFYVVFNSGPCPSEILTNSRANLSHQKALRS